MGHLLKDKASLSSLACDSYRFHPSAILIPDSHLRIPAETGKSEHQMDLLHFPLPLSFTHRLTHLFAPRKTRQPAVDSCINIR